MKRTIYISISTAELSYMGVDKMSSTYRVVRLLKNRIYPTYQLHAFMASKKTTPQDGLRLAGLVTMEWLRQRLGDNAPKELLNLPNPSDYLSVDDSSLPSLHINSGFLIDIVSLPSHGVWSLQLTEPDLGSDPGNPEQARQAVPGRVIETNVGFKISGTQLECGFQTNISDPEGTSQLAEVYRLAFIRRLVDNPDFGLKQITKLVHEPANISSAEQLKAMLSICKDQINQLPCVVFTYAKTAREPLMEELSLYLKNASSCRNFTSVPNLTIPENQMHEAADSELPYDVNTFSKYGVTFCRSYILDDNLLERFVFLSGLSVHPGDIIVFEPVCFGGKSHIVPYIPSKSRREEAMRRLKEELYCYSREKKIFFGNIQFLSAAREGLLRQSADAIQQTAAASDLWAQKMVLKEAQWQEQLRKKDSDYQALAEQLERQRRYQERIEKEKEQLREDNLQEYQKFKRLLAEKDEDIAYLKRKLSQPTEHCQIAAWIESNFSKRLILHPKAKTLLEDKSAKSISVELICDALDFLATDYWDRRYLQISTDEMNSRCSEKYGRPFEVKPIGTTTIEFTPSQYKIKYFIGALGKPVESALDFHLCVGNDSQNLLRIYFLHDDKKKLIVVGSLPKHLKAVTIK